MRRKIYNIVTLISIFCLIVCICFKFSYRKFDSSNVKKNIGYLSSAELKGRLAGTKENSLTASKIAQQFKSLKLKPLKDDFEDKFSINVPVYTGGKSSMKLINSDNSITDFTLGQDFKEDFINFKNSSIEFSKNDTVSIYNNGFSIFKDNIEYVFYVNFDKNFSFRSSFFDDSKYGFVIQISTNTFSRILESLRGGSTLKIDLPYKVCEKEICNVVGKIEGYCSSLPPLILTAHFDHVGSDCLGNYYPGALDNASGTSFLLELAQSYSSLRIPKRDIIFVALNAEELGLKGSEDFASKYEDLLRGSEVINFDMIGADNYPITLMSGKNCTDNNSKLLNSIEKICADQNIDIEKSFADSSDHASFINHGFDSLTISHCDTSNIHTTNDTCDKISEDAIENMYDIVNSKVKESAYDDIFIIFYNNYTFIFFSFLSGALVVFKYVNQNLNNKIK